MGQPRASRKKAVVISSDEEDDSPALPSDASEDDKHVKPQNRSTGKLKPVERSSKQQQPTPVNSTPDAGSQKSPAKPKASKAKSKTAVKDRPKSNARPIYSFFNAATQRQQASQPSASPEKRPTVENEPDAIHDDSDEASGPIVEPSRGSSIALAMRKRKLGHNESFETDASLPLPGSQKFRKTSGGEKVPSLSVFNEDKRPWTEQFAPKDLSELAVHKGKVSDVRKWLEAALRGGRQKALVLKGAAGTGKTATLRLLAQDMRLKVIEWKNPAVSDQTAEGTTSTAPQFQEFVGRAGRSGGLQFSSEDNELAAAVIEDEQTSETQGQLLLIEEFPSTFSRTSSTLQSFRSTILQYLSAPSITDTTPTPVIMIISETMLSTSTALADSFTAHRLLGAELTNHPFLDMIEYNAVARTILTKALEAVVLKEARKSGRRKTPGPQIIQELAESGDIRSAISSLEFLCLRGDDGETWSSKVTFTKQKKAKSDPKMTKFEEDALKLICNRESTLGIFHAVGKVMYNKRRDAPSAEPIAHPPTWLPQHRRSKVWENDVDEVLNELGTDVSTFIAALHENYALSCSSTTTEDTLDGLLGCMNSISDSDLLSIDRFSFGTRAFSGSATDSLRQDEMAFQTAVRGLVFSFPYPVKRVAPPGSKKGDERKVFYPSSLRQWKKREEVEGTLELLTSKFQGESITGLNVADAKSNAGLGGVESWKRDISLTVNTEQAAATDGPPSLRSGSAKTEMLIERLPYMAQILGSRASSKLLDSMHSVTRVHGMIPPSEEEDEREGEEDNLETAPEQWSTDRPELDAEEKTKRDRAGPKRRLTRGIEGGGLAIPVESGVEKLVLEDDDIVDD